MKRLMDFALASIGLIFFSPFLLIMLLLVWLDDRHSPIYVAKRVGLHGKTINVYKMRSMRVDADKLGGDSTSSADARITRLGHFIRAYKFDELLQLWNVVNGSMSLVGPRPNVRRDVELYTASQQKLLTVRPGITDFSSIVFSDEGEILSKYDDPDQAFNELIRPWKIRLGLFYIDHRNVWIDLQLIILTVVAIFSKKNALNHLCKILINSGASEDLVKTSSRSTELQPYLITN